MNNKSTPPPIKKFSAFEEMTRIIEEQAREIERLKSAADAIKCLAISSMEAQTSGVVLPERKDPDGYSAGSPEWHAAHAHNDCMDEVARLNSPPVSADLIRFDFTNAEGQPDIKMMTHDEMRQRYSDLLISNAMAMGGGSNVSAGAVDEREAFEAAIRDDAECSGLDADLSLINCLCDGQVIYANPITQACWWAWQARAALTTRLDIDALHRQADQLRAEVSRLKAGQGEAVEVVAWLNAADGVTTSSPVSVMDWDDEKRHVESLMTVTQHNRIVAAIAYPPSDPGTVPVRRELLGSVAKHLGNWLSHDLCECEGAHCCGRDEVDRDLDKLRAILAQHEGAKP